MSAATTASTESGSELDRSGRADDIQKLEQEEGATARAPCDLLHIVGG